jgi:tetratricopeptide (TPR) repeat protein
MDEAEENNLGNQAKMKRWERWHTCSLCEQEYHGVVRCALGWACWKTYLGRPETDQIRRPAMTQLGNGLAAAEHHVDALAVQEAELSTLRRLGAPDDAMLVTQGNLAGTYYMLGRMEEASQIYRDVYSGRLKLNGAENDRTLRAANNYAISLVKLERFEEAKAILRRMVPVARRFLGESHDLTISLRCNYTAALYENDDATLDDLREAVTSLEDTTRIARRVFGGAHPMTTNIERRLRNA